MKYFLVLALAVVGALAAPRADSARDVLDDVTAALKLILDNIPEPLLDVHGTDEKKLDLGFELLTFTSYDIVLSGIKSLDYSSTTYDDATGRLEYEWIFPSIEADVKFDLTLSGILDAENNPVVKVVLNNLKLKGYAVVNSESSPAQLSDFQLVASLEGADVSLKGILNDDDLSEKLEVIFNNQLPALVDDIVALVEPLASPVIKSLINIVIRLLD